MENRINLTEAPGITSVSDLTRYASGAVVQFPDFAEDQPFIARIRRPSMLMLIKGGKIPNELLLTANGLFAGEGYDTTSKDSLRQVFDILDTVAEACFIEPTYKEIKAAGLELTDDQMMFIFNYTQKGVRALDSFRKE